MGQKLALKHLLVDPKEKAREEAAKAAEAEAALKAAQKEDESSEAESEWTWETCSESEAEDLELDKPPNAEPATVLKPVLFLFFVGSFKDRSVLIIKQNMCMSLNYIESVL